MPNKYISIDIETTGLDPDNCQILEFGAVIEDWVTPVEELPRFHCYIVHDVVKGNPKAFAMNGAILNKIADREGEDRGVRYLTPQMLGFAFQHWLDDCGIDSGASIVAAGKNFSGFDRQFLERCPEFHAKFKHRCIDPAMLFWNPETDEVPPSTKECMERAGIEGEVAHTAIEDALGIIRLVRYGTSLEYRMKVAMEMFQAQNPTVKTAGYDSASGTLIFGVEDSLIHRQPNFNVTDLINFANKQ